MKFLLAMHGQFMVRLVFTVLHCASCVVRGCEFSSLCGRGARRGLSPRGPRALRKFPPFLKLPPYFHTEEQFRFSHVDSDVDLYGANFKS
jgi:hypothetical protein